VKYKRTNYSILYFILQSPLNIL